MLANFRRRIADRDSGFTLIELIVVVVILGVLTAIAIPSYGAIQENARERAVKSATQDVYKHVQASLAKSGTYNASELRDYSAINYMEKEGLYYLVFGVKDGKSTIYVDPAPDAFVVAVFRSQSNPSYFSSICNDNGTVVAKDSGKVTLSVSSVLIYMPCTNGSGK